MKIDGDKLSAQTTPTERLDATSAQGASGRKTPLPGATTDQLQLSPDAQLVRAAVDAAAGSPALRGELVERMRALIADGQVGADAERLADALIQSALNEEQ